ncbi:MAG: hypothetical protein M1819_001503 [Sarea resinae]|nr:MAG: hypothetical protein M1819_001503 [Sarea resinae]
MSSSGDDTRAQELAQRALESVSRDRLEEGARLLREAASISPENKEVKAAFAKIQQEEAADPLAKLCRRFVLQKDAAAGKEALRLVERSNGQISHDVGEQCLKILLERPVEADETTADELVGGILRQSLGARAYLATQIDESQPQVFESLWEKGDAAIGGLVLMLLDTMAWASQETRDRMEHDVFQLLLAKLMEAGQDHPGRALRGIARLLAADAEKLKYLIDEDTLDPILTSLDNRRSQEVRSQATLATAKYLEVSGDAGHALLTKFVTSRIAKHTNDQLITALSVAAAVFPIVPSMASSLFLTEGFVPSLESTVNKKLKSSKAEHAALELLSAACIDRACREAISKYCSEWLEDILEDGNDPSPGMAALILAKIRSPSGENSTGKDQRVQEEAKSVNALVDMFQKMMVKESVNDKQSSIEGLAFTSLQPTVKERLAKDKPFLKSLISTLEHTPPNSSIIFGGLNIFVNITSYLPNLSEEQKRLSQLKAYANTSKVNLEPDPLNKDPAVTVRCKAVLDAGLVPLLLTISRKVSPTALSLILTILLSLSRDSKNRGPLAQQGAVKLILQAYSAIPDTTASATDIVSRRTAAHTLARILISVNPSHIFGSSALPITSAIRPLVFLLPSSDDDGIFDDNGPRDLLPTFESLLALTNLASTDDPTRHLILQLSFKPVTESLLLHSNPLLQRAAVELICNLMALAETTAKFADGSPAANNRLHILLALADAEDEATRRAAGGALAMLTEWDEAVKAVVARDRGVKILLGLCEEHDDESLVHRGVVCVQNIVCALGEAGRQGTEKVKQEGGVEVLKAVLMREKNPGVLEAAVEALKRLI